MQVARAEAIVAGEVAVIRHLTMARIVAQIRQQYLVVVVATPRALITIPSEAHVLCSRHPRLVALVVAAPSVAEVALSEVALSEVALSVVAVMAQVWAVAVCAQAVVNDIKPHIVPEHIETNKI